MIGNTWFGRKLPARYAAVPHADVVAQYRRLVFGETDRLIRPGEAKAGRHVDRRRKARLIPRFLRKRRHSD